MKNGQESENGCPASSDVFRENDDLFRYFVENANDIVYALSLEGLFTYVSPNWLDFMGEPAEKAVGTSFEPYVHPDEVPLYQDFLQRILTTGDKKGSVEYRVQRCDGVWRWHVSRASLIRDDAGNATGYMGIARDITERKRVEEERERLQAQLLQAQKMEAVGRLAGGVAHDFNNMLGAILGHAELAMGKAAEQDESLIDDLKAIIYAANRSADITRQLLAFARKQTIQPKVLNLNQMVEGMLKMLRRIIGEDIDLTWLPGGNLWPVRMDPSQIDQILVNLCVNARDAIEDVGKLVIATDTVVLDEASCAGHAGLTPGDFVLLTVKDDGRGMDRQTLEKVFEPFFTTKGLGKGTGLGLATVYGIVEQNQGIINVESEIGKGTTFRIYLPALKEGKAPRTASEQGGVLLWPRGSETILLVEDEQSILKMTTVMLELLGYTVLAADTPDKAIDLAREHADEIHLLMTDVIMPAMNGRDLAKKLLTLYPNVKCLFMSGYTANVIERHGVMQQGMHFLQKPFSVKAVAAKVRQALDEPKQ